MHSPILVGVWTAGCTPEDPSVQPVFLATVRRPLRAVFSNRRILDVKVCGTIIMSLAHVTRRMNYFFGRQVPQMVSLNVAGSQGRLQ